MMKKLLLIIFALIICLIGASGLILEKIILSQIPKIMAQIGNGNTHFSFDSVKGDSGFANTKLVFINPRIETLKGTYRADKISLKVSLFSPKTLNGEISENIYLNQIHIQSEPIYLKFKIGSEKKITLTAKNLSVFKNGKIASMRAVDGTGTIMSKQLFATLECSDVSLPIIPVNQFSDIKKIFADVSYQLGGNEVLVRKSDIDFGEIQALIQGRIRKDAFVLDTQIRGWEKLLRELTARGFIGENNRKIISTALKLLSVRGVLRAPVIWENGILYVGKYPLINLSQGTEK